MPTVRQLLDEKGDKVFSVAPTDTVYDALRKMEETDVGSLIVIDGEKVVGIITERDYARKVILKGRASPTTRVQDIMQTKVLYAEPDQAVEECMAIMTDKKVRHLPVFERGTLVGLISIGDLVKSVRRRSAWRQCSRPKACWVPGRLCLIRSGRQGREASLHLEAEGLGGFEVDYPRAWWAPEPAGRLGSSP